jgi:hypothetical protein
MRSTTKESEGMSLTTCEIRHHLEKITYRPNWTFRVYDGTFEGQHLVINAEVENSYSRGDWVYLDIHTFMPPMASTADLERFLAWRLARIEVHEMREWLKRDGKAIYDPHAEGADKDDL